MVLFSGSQALLALVACIHLQGGLAFYEQGTDVITMTSKNWKDISKSDHLWVVEFYREGCGYCELLRPEWEKAATNLKHLAKIAALDVTQEQSIASRYKISGVPTIKLFKPTYDKDGKRKLEEIDYNGERKAKPIVDFATYHIPSHVVALKSSSVDGFLSDTSLPKMLIFSKSQSTSAMVKALSIEHRNKVQIGEIRGSEAPPSLFDRFNFKPQDLPKILFFYSDDTQGTNPVEYTQKPSYRKLDMFMWREARNSAKAASSKDEL